MHHGRRHFHARRETVGQDAAHAAFQHGQQAARICQVAGIHLQGGRQLAFQAFRDRQQLFHVAAGHQQGSRTEDFVAQIVPGQKRLARGDEQGGGALAFLARVVHQRCHVGMLRQRGDTLGIAAGDAGRQHGGGRGRCQRFGGSGGKGRKVGAFQAQHEAGIGAELAHAHGQRGGKAAGNGRATGGQRLRKHEHGVDAAHFSIDGDRLRTLGRHLHQGDAARTRTRETHGLDGRVGDQGLADAIARACQQGEHARRQLANLDGFDDGARHQLGGARVGRVGFQHDRAAGRQGRGGIAAGHREGQREVTGRKHGDGAQADHAQAQIRTRRRAIGQSRIDARIGPRAFAQQAGEQF